MYIIFRVGPYHRNIARSILKAPKYYFYDTGQVIGDQGTKLENLIACALLKEIHYLEDCYGEESQLYFLRTKNGKEIDFFITKDDAPLLMLEVKWADSKLSSSFPTFARYFPNIKKIQLVKELNREKTHPDGSEIRLAHTWLSEFSLAG